MADYILSSVLSVFFLKIKNLNFSWINLFHGYSSFIYRFDVSRLRQIFGSSDQYSFSTPDPTFSSTRPDTVCVFAWEREGERKRVTDREREGVTTAKDEEKKGRRVRVRMRETRKGGKSVGERKYCEWVRVGKIVRERGSERKKC